jgi:hypothetical protein
LVLAQLQQELLLQELLLLLVLVHLWLVLVHLWLVLVHLWLVLVLVPSVLLSRRPHLPPSLPAPNGLLPCRHFLIWARGMRPIAWLACREPRP